MAQPQQQAAPGVVRFYNFLSEDVFFLGEVLSGLSAPQKTLPANYFYDARGCALFEKICELPEYYCARAGFAPAQGWNDPADLFSVQGMLAV